MELCTFAADGGFPEAVLRGQKLSLLSQDKYEQMKNLTSIKQLKDFLIEETDFKDFFEGLQLTTEIDTLQLMGCIKNKLADELKYLEGNCINPCFEFIGFLRTPYMIDNVVNIINGTKNKTSRHDIEANINPIGRFDEIEMMLKTDSDDTAGLWEILFTDCPLSDHILKFFKSKSTGGKERDFKEVDTFFKEIDPQEVGIGLKKLWIEDFILFCDEKLNPLSAANMIHILRQKADFMTIQAVYNTLSREKQERLRLRKDYTPTCGYLYEDGQYKTLCECDSLDSLREKVKHHPTYQTILNGVPDPTKVKDGNEGRDASKFDNGGLDQAIFKAEVEDAILVFDEQANYAAFYAYMILKEQEYRNIGWVASMIGFTVGKNDPRWERIILPMDSKDV
jgi:V-type H+-transporting ATPase subunit d